MKSRYGSPRRMTWLMLAFITAFTITGLSGRAGAARPAVIDTHRSVGPVRHGHGGRLSPRIALFAATPSVLPAVGGRVALTALVTGRASCTLSSTPAQLRLPRTATCRATRLVRLMVMPNRSDKVRLLHFRLVIRAGRRQFATSVAIKQRALFHLAPFVYDAPTSESVPAGSWASFRARVLGRPRIVVRWQRSSDGGRRWAMIVGARRSTYRFIATGNDNGYEYRAVFSNRAGRMITKPAVLTVRAPLTGEGPEITENPTSTALVAGETATFSALASGSPAPAIQWLQSSNAGAAWSAIPGATTSILSFPAKSAENGDEYEATFTNSSGTATTSPASLSVTPATTAPSVIAQPAPLTVNALQYASFVAGASGSPTPDVQWRISTDGGTTWGNIAGATSSTYGFLALSSEDGDEFDAVFSNSAGATTSSPVTLTVSGSPSSNWSGYATTGTAFGAVGASWRVPSVSCTASENAYSSVWIGLDGDLASSTTVEQDGTESDCVNGAPVYDAWYEMFGDSSVNNGAEVELSPTSYPVNPGDLISASVSDTSGVFTLYLQDATASWSDAITIGPAAPIGFDPQLSSAEWIVERPVIDSSLTSLADFGSVDFSNATATSGTSQPISAYDNSAIDMVSSGYGSGELASPTRLDPSGTSFAVEFR